MPDLVTIHEARGFFSSAARITGVTVELGEYRYSLESHAGKLKAKVAMVVRGITLNTKDVDPAEWVTRLAEETQKASEHARALSTSLLEKGPIFMAKGG